MTTINDILNAWYASSDEVVRFGRDLLHSGYLETHNAIDDEWDRADALLQYFEKPHHWNRVHAWWDANEWPDDAASWEHGHDTAWEVS